MIEQAKQLEQRITTLIYQTRNTLDDQEKELQVKRIKQLSKDYFKLTGYHYNIDRVKEEYQ